MQINHVTTVKPMVFMVSWSKSGDAKVLLVEYFISSKETYCSTCCISHGYLNSLTLSASSKIFDTLIGTSMSVEKPSDKLVLANGEFSAGFYPRKH